MQFYSQKVNDYIIFSYIKEFVSELCKVYNDAPLHSYMSFIEDANILTDTSEFVEKFKPAVDGTRRAEICDGAFINIPLFISKNDANLAVIKAYLSFFKKLYENTEENCKEMQFMKEYGQQMYDEMPSELTEGADTKDVVKQIVAAIRPDLEKTKNEFNARKLNGDRFTKIILVGIYEKISSTDDGGEDTVHVKNIINILANNPINKLMDFKLELLKEFMSIKKMSSLPIDELCLGGNLAI